MRWVMSLSPPLHVNLVYHIHVDLLYSYTSSETLNIPFFLSTDVVVDRSEPELTDWHSRPEHSWLTFMYLGIPIPNLCSRKSCLWCKIEKLNGGVSCSSARGRSSTTNSMRRKLDSHLPRSVPHESA